MKSVVGSSAAGFVPCSLSKVHSQSFTFLKCTDLILLLRPYLQTGAGSSTVLRLTLTIQPLQGQKCPLMSSAVLNCPRLSDSVLALWFSVTETACCHETVFKGELLGWSESEMSVPLLQPPQGCEEPGRGRQVTQQQILSHTVNSK